MDITPFVRRAQRQRLSLVVSLPRYWAEFARQGRGMVCCEYIVYIACTRAVKAECKASCVRFYKKQKGLKTVKDPLQGSKLLFSPWSGIDDRYIGEDAGSRCRIKSTLVFAVENRNRGILTDFITLLLRSAPERRFSRLDVRFMS